jgi:primase-polymerase (primpol)-like protein
MHIIAENIPSELKALDRWVGWRFEMRPDASEPTKPPFQCNGHKADKTNPRHQTSFANVYEVYSTGRWLGRRVHFDGVGFCFMPGDGFLGADLDDIWMHEADEGALWGLEILERFIYDTYSELSPSGRGAKIWCRGVMPEGRGRWWKIAGGAVEMASQGKYFTVTGQSAEVRVNGKSTHVRVIADMQSEIDQLIQYLDEDGGAVKPASGVVEGRIPHGTQHLTLVSIAGALRRRGVCDEAVEACLQQVNLRQCEKPGPPANISRIVRSTAKWRR